MLFRKAYRLAETKMWDHICYQVLSTHSNIKHFRFTRIRVLLLAVTGRPFRETRIISPSPQVGVAGCEDSVWGFTIISEEMVWSSNSSMGARMMIFFLRLHRCKIRRQFNSIAQMIADLKILELQYFYSRLRCMSANSSEATVFTSNSLPKANRRGPGMVSQMPNGRKYEVQKSDHKKYHCQKELYTLNNIEFASNVHCSVLRR